MQSSGLSATLGRWCRSERKKTASISKFLDHSDSSVASDDTRHVWQRIQYARKDALASAHYSCCNQYDDSDTYGKRTNKYFAKSSTKIGISIGKFRWLNRHPAPQFSLQAQLHFRRALSRRWNERAARLHIVTTPAMKNRRIRPIKSTLYSSSRPIQSRSKYRE